MLCIEFWDSIIKSRQNTLPPHPLYLLTSSPLNGDWSVSPDRVICEVKRRKVIKNFFLVLILKTLHTAFAKDLVKRRLRFCWNLLVPPWSLILPHIVVQPVVGRVKTITGPEEWHEAHGVEAWVQREHGVRLQHGGLLDSNLVLLRAHAKWILETNTIQNSKMSF
jgi:hypothetical protein